MKLSLLISESSDDDVPSFKDLMESCCESAKKLGFSIQKLENGTPIIRKKGEKTLSIISGIHGDERSGPLFLRELLRRFEIGEKEVPDIGLCIVPLLNDRGWKKNDRYWGSVDLNDSFKASSECKAQIALLDYYRKNVPDIHWDVHEDYRVDYSFVFQYSKDSTGFIKTFSEKLNCKVEDYKSLDYSSESFVRRLGVEKVVTSEVPPSWSWDKKYKWLGSAFDFLVAQVEK